MHKLVKKAELRRGRVSKGSKTSVNSNSTASPSNARHTMRLAVRDSPPPLSRAESPSKLHPVEVKRKRSISRSDDELPVVSELIRRGPIATHLHKKRKVGFYDRGQAKGHAQLQRKALLSDSGEAGSDNDESSDPPKGKVREKVVGNGKKMPLEVVRRTKSVKNSSSRKTVSMKVASKRRPQVPTDTGSSSETELEIESKVVKGEAIPNRKESNKNLNRKTYQSSEILAPSQQHSPVLSPGAKERLARFDALDLDFVDNYIHGLSRQVNEEPSCDDFGQNNDTENALVGDNMYDDNYDDVPKAPPAKVTSTPIPKSKATASNHKRKPNGGVPRASSPAVLDNSYLIGVVPETEPESNNNTQSQSQPKSNNLLPRPTSPSLPPHTLNTPNASPRTTLISRMKPRTPSSSNLSPRRPPPLHEPPSPLQRNMKTNPKPLRPLPVVSPSTFRPHLSSEPPEPSGSGSHIESAHGPPRTKVYTPSPIEHFSSPEKEGGGGGGGARDKRKYGGRKTSAGSDSDELSLLHVDPDPGRKKSSRSSSAKVVVESHLAERGRELAERAWQKKMPSGTGMKRSLDELLQVQKGWKTVPGERAPDGVAGVIDVGDEGHTESWGIMEEGAIGAVPGAVSAETQTQEESILQEMVDAYVDLEGEGESGRKGPVIEQTQGQVGEDDVPAYIRYRREEEESTQDVLVPEGGLQKDGAELGESVVDVADRGLDAEMMVNHTGRGDEEQGNDMAAIIEVGCLPPLFEV